MTGQEARAIVYEIAHQYLFYQNDKQTRNELRNALQCALFEPQDKFIVVDKTTDEMVDEGRLVVMLEYDGGLMSFEMFYEGLDSGTFYIARRGPEVKTGLVNMPYQMVMKQPGERDASDNEYDAFMDQYKIDHAVCPKCGSNQQRTSLIGYVFNRDKKEEYRDRNRCTCMDCGSIHIKHDLISEEQFIINNAKVFTNPDQINTDMRWDNTQDVI